MNAKEYLSQALALESRVNSRLEVLARLNDLARKTTSVMTGMPGGSSKSTSSMADTIDKIVDLQAEINRDIDALVDLKAEILRITAEVRNPQHREVLEKRYLCMMDWSKIAEAMNLTERWVLRLHGRALAEVEEILSKSERSR